MTFFFILIIPFTITIPQAIAQSNVTPVITTPPLSSGLQFIPQQAYVQTVPPPSVASSESGSLQDMIIPVIVSVVGIVAAKMHSDKKTSKVADVVQGTVLPQQVKQSEKTKELARVTYDMNPEAAAKITDAPTVKITTLTEDTAKFAEKAASTKLP